jgi:hypothetical protein
MRINSGKEALELLLHSNRASDDIRWTQMHSSAGKWSMQIVVREWEDIEPELELRAFVTKVETLPSSSLLLVFLPILPSESVSLNVISSVQRVSLPVSLNITVTVSYRVFGNTRRSLKTWLWKSFEKYIL